MAGLQTYYNFCYNFFSTNKNTFVGVTKRSNILILIFIGFCAFISTLAHIFASILSLPGIYIDVDLQQATNLALKLFIKGQKYAQANFTSQD